MGQASTGKGKPTSVEVYLLMRASLQDSLNNDVFGEGRGGLDVLQELKDKVDSEVRSVALVWVRLG